MRKRNIKRVSALLLASAILLTACGNQNEEVNNSQNNVTSEVSEKSSETSTENKEKEITKISLYPQNANLLSGLVAGHKAEYLAENGLELEVWAYSDEKTNAILASGDLPDIMYVSYQNLPTMIEAGMILPLDDYLDQMPNYQKYDQLHTATNYLREFQSAGTGKVYGMPTTVGSPAQKAIPNTDRYAVRLHWDIYEEIGAPEIADFDSLVDVMLQMKQAHPTDADGNTIYGTVLNGGSDSTFFKMMTAWWQWHGYDSGNYCQPYLLELNMVNGEVTSILEEDSLYREGLEWYNKLYRNGLIDPDSINIDRSTQAPKVNNGLAYVPSGFLPGWEPTYYQYYIPGTNIYYNNELPYGAASVIAINAKTTNLDACLAFLDLMIDPFTQFRLNYGPEGDAWYIDGDKMYLTERFKGYLRGNEWNISGYTYANGEEMAIFNTPFILHQGEPLSYKDDNGKNRSVLLTNWSEFAEASQSNETFVKWQKTTGYNNWVEWIEAENAYYTEGPLDGIFSFLSTPDDVMQLTISAIKDIVVNASWKMVYAESEEEFDKIWNQMVADCEGLGCKDIMDWRLADIDNAIAIRDSLAK